MHTYSYTLENQYNSLIHPYIPLYTSSISIFSLTKTNILKKSLHLSIGHCFMALSVLRSNTSTVLKLKISRTRPMKMSTHFTSRSWKNWHRSPGPSGSEYSSRSVLKRFPILVDTLRVTGHFPSKARWAEEQGDTSTFHLSRVYGGLPLGGVNFPHSSSFAFVFPLHHQCRPPSLSEY